MSRRFRFERVDQSGVFAYRHIARKALVETPWAEGLRDWSDLERTPMTELNVDEGSEWNAVYLGFVCALCGARGLSVVPQGAGAYVAGELGRITSSCAGNSS